MQQGQIGRGDASSDRRRTGPMAVAAATLGCTQLEAWSTVVCLVGV